MEFSLLNKRKKKLSRLVLKSNTSQAIDYIIKEDKIDYKNTLMTIFKSLNCEEIEELLSTIKSIDKNKYEALLDASNELSIYNDSFREDVYGFETEIENNFLSLYSVAKSSLSTGDLIAFLLKYYFHYKKKRNKIIKPATNIALKEIVICLKRNKALLVTEINNQLYLPISKALFVFFLYNKEEASNKFKNIIRVDLKYKTTSLFELEYQDTADIFFDKLGLDYIPDIDTRAEKYDIVIAEKNKSISKNEISDEIDKNDFFNRKVPLLNFDPKKLINPKTNITGTTNLKEFTKTISIIFNFFHTENKDDLNYDLGEVFIENITQPFPKYPDDVLIRTREILKKMFSENQEFSLIFLGFIFREFRAERLYAWSSKFPELLNEYLGNLDNFSKATIKKYFYHTKRNPIYSKDKIIETFIKKHKPQPTDYQY